MHASMRSGQGAAVDVVDKKNKKKIEKSRAAVDVVDKRGEACR